MRVLVTGASGFVGRALTLRLSQSAEFDVVAAVRSKPPLVDATTASAAVHIVGEVDATTEWRAALQGVNAVVHLAARVHLMKDTASDPLREFRRVNVQGTVRLARQAAEAGLGRFIFVSSIGVNGGQTFDRPFTADDVPAPHTSYAVSKFEAEAALREIAHETGMEVTIVRPPLVYGPGAPGNFGTLMRTLRRGVPLPLGSVGNRRSFVSIENLVDLLATLVEHPAAANQTFMVSDGEDLSTTELLRRLGRALGRPARLIPLPASWLETAFGLLGKPELAQRLCGSLQVDIGQTRARLGWTPPIDVTQALRRTAAAFLARERAAGAAER